MSGFKQITQTFLMVKAYEYFGNIVKNYNDPVYHYNFFRLVEDNFGRSKAVDLIRAGEIGWVVNTSESGGEASGDSIRLRSTAVAAGVPVTTTLAGFEAAVSGLVENGASGGELAVYTLQEYHGRTRK